MEWIALAVCFGVIFFPEELGNRLGRFVGAACTHIRIHVKHTYEDNHGGKS